MSLALFNPSAPLVLEGGTLGLALAALLMGIVGWRRPAVGIVVLSGVSLLFLASLTAEPGGSLLDGSFVVDEMAIFAKRLFLGATAISVLASLALRRGPFVNRAPEYYLALLVSLSGMLVLASARELLLLFVSFELMSIPLYFLTGFDKRQDGAAEAALKFFLIGTVSSAVILYGLSFVYGATGTTAIGAIAPALAAGNPLLTLGLALVLAGLGFKIAAVPFHMWVPDAYQAANIPFVAWLSVAPKAAGFLVIVRLYLEGVGETALMWLPVTAALAAVTMLAGNFMAIPQRSLKRLLAYSGIAHIGYMLIGIAAISSAGVAMLWFYLVAYLFGNMGAFLVVQAVDASESSDTVDAYDGLAERSPVLALSMLIFLLSLGGIPFVAGFWAKLYVFWAAVDRGLYLLAFLGAVLTVVALYYYLLVARRMYIEAPSKAGAIAVPRPVAVAIAICMLGVVGMGVWPGPWVEVVTRVAEGLF